MSEEATDTLDEAEASLPEPLTGPPEYAILVLEIMWAFRDMLHHEHERQAKAAETAKRHCAAHVAELRAVYDPDPELGPREADATIAWAVQNARYLFSRELQPAECQRYQPCLNTAFGNPAAAA